MTTTKVTLVIDSATADGNPFTCGSARIFPSQRISSTADGLLVEIAPVRARFSRCGPPSVELFPCDLIGPQAGGIPAWSYTVYYDATPGPPSSWSFRLLSTDGATQRLSSLTALGT